MREKPKVREWCPFCDHENLDRGSTCLFCGQDLRIKETEKPDDRQPKGCLYGWARPPKRRGG